MDAEFRATQHEAGRGRGWGVSRFVRIWAKISNGHNSKTVRDNPINIVHFCNCQFGWRKRRSIVHALTAILHTWMSSLDSGDSVCTVFVDFRKAFDLVSHNILFSKLIKHNIPRFLLRWFGSYLSGRQQRVRISQSFSSWKELKELWHNLGPLSFLVLINDLSTGCPMHKYVDDTTLTELPKHANTEMSTFLSNLSRENESNMEINTTKTKEMILGALARSNLPLLTTPTGTIDRSLKPHRNALFTSYFTSPAERHTPTC